MTRPAVDLGLHEPRASVGPTRSVTGVREDGRLLSSIEQEEEAIRWMLAQAVKHGDPEILEARIQWSRRAASTLRVTADYETTPTGARIAVLRTVSELDDEGQHVPRTARDRVIEAR
ncbi:MAG TPA: hypothetical protein VFM87_08660, partial [Agrococcus sp.]|nr:hypothetical protein [Agrococcus sp.]